MSIKIYNGYRIRNKNLEEVFKYLNILREDLIKFAQKNVSMNAALEYKNLYLKHLTPEEVKFEIFEHIIKSEKESYQGIINCKWDFVLEFNLYPIFNETNDILILIDSQNSKTYEKILKESDLEEYNYQEEYEKPAIISAEDWKQRYYDWLKVGVIEGTKKVNKNPLRFRGVDWKDYNDILNCNIFKNLINN